MGWEPTETHVHHYDDTGRPLSTTVTRESEWSDHERDKMLGLVEYEAGICECGLHESVADEDPDLEVKPRRCPVCAGLAKVHRILDAEDEKAMKRHGDDPPPDVDRPDDGRHLRLSFKAPAIPGLSDLLDPDPS